MDEQVINLLACADVCMNSYGESVFNEQQKTNKSYVVKLLVTDTTPYNI